MSKLIIAGDIHGYYSAWQKITDLLSKDDTLAIAGDFFDTKYGHQNSTDYNPQILLEEFKKLSNTKYFVYGNCDEEKFSPGYNYHETFKFEGVNILITHGNFQPKGNFHFDILITGHTHTRDIKITRGKILLNPGSIALPKDDSPSYAIIENKKIKLVGLDEGIVKQFDIDSMTFE